MVCAGTSGFTPLLLRRNHSAVPLNVGTWSTHAQRRRSRMAWVAADRFAVVEVPSVRARPCFVSVVAAAPAVPHHCVRATSEQKLGGVVGKDRRAGVRQQKLCRSFRSCSCSCIRLCGFSPDHFTGHCARSIDLHCDSDTGGRQCSGSFTGPHPVLRVTGWLLPSSCHEWDHLLDQRQLARLVRVDL